jgi:hypothetical protein
MTNLSNITAGDRVTLPLEEEHYQDEPRLREEGSQLVAIVNKVTWPEPDETTSGEVVYYNDCVLLELHSLTTDRDMDVLVECESAYIIYAYI